MADKRIPVQRRSIERKQKILSSGFKLFCEHGYYKTNTIEIAKHAGVSTGAVYSYFKDKREILQHLTAISKRFRDVYLKNWNNLRRFHYRISWKTGSLYISNCMQTPGTR